MKSTKFQDCIESFYAPKVNNVLKISIILLFFIHYSLLTVKAQDLWGMTSAGGTHSSGVIFEYNTANNPAYDVKYNFGDITDDGTSPQGSLLYIKDPQPPYNEYFYGMTSSGGLYGYGIIFVYAPSAITKYNVLVNFTGQYGDYPGANPYGSLILASDGNLYGMTSEGGLYGYGVKVIKFVKKLN